MGKREWLLILAFVVVGAVVYRLTAPPAPPGSRGSSVSEIIRDIRREIQGRDARGDHQQALAVPVPASVAELRLADFRGSVTLVGEPREDIAGELRVTAFGATVEEAVANARRVELRTETSAEAVTFRADRAAIQRTMPALTLRVPARLRVRLDALNGPAEVRRVAAVQVAGARGRGMFADVAGAVRGEYRDGALEISGAESVRLTARRGDVRIERVAGEVVLDVTDGRVRGRELEGAVRIDGRRLDLDLDSIDGALEITTVDGEATIRGLRAPLRFDGQRTALELALERPAPVHAATSDEAIDVALPAAGGVDVDAAATRGSVRADATLGLTVSGGPDAEQRAVGAIGGGGPTLTLRSARGDIVIRR
jgi:hypothetical protein